MPSGLGLGVVARSVSKTPNPGLTLTYRAGYIGSRGGDCQVAVHQASRLVYG